mmetsp:Transcript_4942/g.14868  ORF Transcript_4942/g.14868 Transcript_4942/m.14868 type:complete len:211 (+) Transcript_4942:128-760(+)|eukprot:CAMPEP_0198730876 /NCGR_PEP_ID=MMETSP1475-20131203/26820_1 /TAXON_ID= ORGANISM="Unidentified sp., Strain CCMP1999" /NCGR_SAMPLE_ID=MMETSP1475 /ASSEMBLY_ACC=CAM_ASM_001111 /LENGTH=210 /DNA_ID=CAMNT_0044493745 /DNA_START=103 /DNA_END=735 /DNA_ORIENTATION=+
MVYFYNTIDESFVVYAGRDKHENEELIKYGWDEDVWFHVDKLSSAHVYLRLKEGMTIEDIPEKVLEDCAQLVKYNSIEGNKQNNVAVVYTMWGNLKKTGDMDVGQVGFHDQTKVHRTVVKKRANEIVNRLMKTRREEYPKLAEQKEAHLKDVARREREEVRRREKEEKRQRELRAKETEERSYNRTHKEENMMSNKEFKGDYNDYEDSFM